MKPEKGKRTMDSIAPLPCNLSNTHTHTRVCGVRLHLRLRIIICEHTTHSATIQMVSWQTNASVKWAFKPKAYAYYEKRELKTHRTKNFVRTERWTLDFWFYDFMFCEKRWSRKKTKKTRQAAIKCTHRNTNTIGTVCARSKGEARMNIRERWRERMARTRTRTREKRASGWKNLKIG